jgi:hypothetical protein
MINLFFPWVRQDIGETLVGNVGIFTYIYFISSIRLLGETYDEISTASVRMALSKYLPFRQTSQ